MGNNYNTKIQPIESTDTDTEAYQKVKSRKDDYSQKGKTATKSHEVIKSISIKNLYETETVRDKDVDMPPSPKDEKKDEYQVNKPKRVILRAKLIND